MSHRLYKSNLLHISIIYFLLAGSVTLYEFFIFLDWNATFLILKSIGVIAPALFMIALYTKGYSRRTIFLLDASLIFYCVMGELYSNLYFFAFLQMNLGKIFIIKQEKRDYLVSFLVGSTALITVYFLKYNGMINLSDLRPSVSDYWLTAICFSVLIIFQNFKFQDAVEQNKADNERLAVLGENSNILLHNVKGQFASQMILVDNMADSLDNRNELAKLLSLSKGHLKEVQKYLTSVNKFQNSDAHPESQKTNFQVLDVIEESLLLLGLAKENITSKGTSFLVNANREDVLTIFLNVFSNALKSTPKLYRKNDIQVTISEQIVLVTHALSKNKNASSGIGNVVSEKLAFRNEMDFNVVFLGEEMTYSLAFS